LLNHKKIIKSDRKNAWILCGYNIFSKDGPKGLKIEVIARAVNKSKSSFYHHFADLEVFTEKLLQYHLERIKLIFEKERQCKNVVPELLILLIEVKEDLFFNRQLRVNRNVKIYKDCFEKSSKKAVSAIVGIWAAALGLKNNSTLADMILSLSLENFFLQITEETLTYEWLADYVTNLQMMVKEFEKRNSVLYGSV
jgi:AcrR family transcriptional regulator